MYNRGIVAGKLSIETLPSMEDKIVTKVQKKELLRYVIFCAHHIHLFRRLHHDSDKFKKLVNHKLEMCMICLMHLEMRVGENMFASLYQEILKRVRTFNPF